MRGVRMVSLCFGFTANIAKRRTAKQQHLKQLVHDRHVGQSHSIIYPSHDRNTQKK